MVRTGDVCARRRTRALYMRAEARGDISAELCFNDAEGYCTVVDTYLASLPRQALAPSRPGIAGSPGVASPGAKFGSPLSYQSIWHALR